MLLKYFYDRELAQASYLVGCAATGEAMVIDPARDISPYLAAAAQEKLRITHVTETHIHADFVSGSRELAAATGAALYLSDMGDDDWKYGFGDEPNVVPVRDGDRWMVGNVRVEALHTPGHTPEHLAFLITDTKATDKPMGVFTGDFLFAGDIGRPDLLEEAAGVAGSKEEGARRQFQSIQRFKTLPDYLQIWPGHGAGSACGKALGAVPSTTLGYEKLVNPAFQFTDEEAFIRWLLEGQPEVPHYFAQMKRVNKVGPALLATLPSPQPLDQAALNRLLAEGAQIMDLRAAEEYRRAALPGVLNIPATADNFSTYVGWFVDYTRPLYLIVPDLAALPALLRSLRAIGVDHIAGVWGPDVIGEGATTLPAMTVQELAQRLHKNGLIILDVRGRSEFQAEHIAGARNIPLGFLPKHLAQLPHEETLVLQCASGYRSQIAASLLRAKGFANVVALTGDSSEWRAALPVVKEA
ncbi:MAG TPA: rhodanese-like domain-containing protein [Caldilineaceae bacterium]|nr:rhodanese-like domain-containing protein [Caldilineaceae bacterium]